ncbi:MAG: hypothetical protein ACI95C_000402 [Pseudohongiellaceae bacterium]|jgi:hypothetical protein
MISKCLSCQILHEAVHSLFSSSCLKGESHDSRKKGVNLQWLCGLACPVRHKIVEGAVGMVDLALAALQERNVVVLDNERKAAMVSNLLVILCGESAASPVVNAGSLYT